MKKLLLGPDILIKNLLVHRFLLQDSLKGFKEGIGAGKRGTFEVRSVDGKVINKDPAYNLIIPDGIE